MKIEGYEEISEEEYMKLPAREGAAFINLDEGKDYHFKKVQKFPICFEDDEVIILIDKDGIHMGDKQTKQGLYLWFYKSFPLLVKAVEKAKEVMKKNGTNKRISC